MRAVNAVDATFAFSSDNYKAALLVIVEWDCWSGERSIREGAGSADRVDNVLCNERLQKGVVWCVPRFTDNGDGLPGKAAVKQSHLHGDYT